MNIEKVQENVQGEYRSVTFRYQYAEVTGSGSGCPVMPAKNFISDDPVVQRFLPDWGYSVPKSDVPRLLDLAIERAKIYRQHLLAGDSEGLSEMKAYNGIKPVGSIGTLGEIFIAAMKN